MPFKSEAQRRYLWANEPEIARDWTDTYGSKIQAAKGGIMRVPLAYGMSPGEAQARGLGAESHGRDFGGKDETAHRNIHAGMTSPSMTTAGTLSDPREKQDYFTQTYSGQPNFLGFGGGYRNLRTPNNAGSGYQSRLNPMGLMSILGGFIDKPFTLAARGINTLRNKFGPAFNNFTSSETLEEFRDKMRGYGRTMPTYSPYLNFGGIETLGQEMPEETNIDEFTPYGVDVENLYEEFLEDEDEDKDEAMLQKIKDYYIV